MQLFSIFGLQSGGVMISGDIANGVKSLRFDSRAGQIGHCVVFGSPTLRHFFRAMLPSREDGPCR